MGKLAIGTLKLLERSLSQATRDWVSIVSLALTAQHAENFQRRSDTEDCHYQRHTRDPATRSRTVPHPQPGSPLKSPSPDHCSSICTRVVAERAVASQTGGPGLVHEPVYHCW